MSCKCKCACNTLEGPTKENRDKYLKELEEILKQKASEQTEPLEIEVLYGKQTKEDV